MNKTFFFLYSTTIYHQQVQIQELKALQAGTTTSLRSSLLDPAVNVLIQHLRGELEKSKSALEETQNELSAWKFTPDRLFFIALVRPDCCVIYVICKKVLSASIFV